MLQGRVNMRDEKMMEKDKNFYTPVISVYPPSEIVNFIQ